MNTSQDDPVLNQPSSTNSLLPSSTPANSFAEDPAPTPTRFLAECGLFTGTPIISGYSEVNPFEASFAHPARQANPGTPNTSRPNLAVTTLKKEFVKSLKSNPVVDERFSGLHLLADESISTPPLPVLAANSSKSAPSNNPVPAEPSINDAPESTRSIQSGSISKLKAMRNSYAPNTYSRQTSAFSTGRAVDTSVQATSTFPSTLSSSSAAPDSYKESSYEHANVSSTKPRTKYQNNHVAPYGYTQSTQDPNERIVYGTQSPGSAMYQKEAESATSALPGQKRKTSTRSGDKWNPQYASSSIDRREQKSRSMSRDSSENRSTMSRTYRDEEDSNGSNDEETPEEKRQRFLERNRMAASKCRQKKKQWVQELEHQADEITITNKNLQNLVSQLKEEVMGLKSQLLAHRNCDCNVIQHYVQSSGQFGGTGTFNSSLRSVPLQSTSRLYGGAGGHNSARDAMHSGVAMSVSSHVDANSSPTAV